MALFQKEMETEPPQYLYQPLSNPQTIEEGSVEEQDHHPTSGPLFRLEVSFSKSRDAIKTHIIKALLFILPTFIQKLIRPPKEKRKFRKTSFLDGVRGVAALLVVVWHQMGPRPYWYNRPFYLGPYEEGEDPQDYTSPIQLPYVRLLFQMGSVVPVFFVISGYVLSHRPVQHIRTMQKESGTTFANGKLAEMLFSSIFRRGIRLFIPSVIGLFLLEVEAAMGMAQYGYSGPDLSGYFNDWLRFLNIFFTAVWHLDVDRIEVLMQFWTIPVEFTCSMGLYVLIMGISGLSTSLRMSVVAAIMVMCIQSGHLGFFGFFGGLFIAELEEIYVDRAKVNKAELPPQYRDEEHEMSSVSEDEVVKLDEDRFVKWRTSMSKRALSVAHDIVWLVILVVTLYFMGWPMRDANKDPLTTWAARVLGQFHTVNFWCFWFVACLFRFGRLQKVYTTGVAMYLGDISYSMYIVHYSILQYYADKIALHAGGFFGHERVGHANRLFANMYEVFLFLCIVIWVADLFWRIVDIPTVRFGRWIEQKCRADSK